MPKPGIWCAIVNTTLSRQNRQLTATKNIEAMKNFKVIFATLLYLMACEPSSTSQSPGGLTFVHLNDTYRIDPVEEGRSGGFGRVATLVRQLQAQGREVRLLHGGDFIYPSLESQLWEGEQMVEALNFLDSIAPLTVVAGNHEFDSRNPDSLIARIRESEFDWMADNIHLNTGANDVDAKLHNGFTFDHDDRKIAIFSLTLEPADGGNDRSYTLFQDDYMTVARASIERLSADGADYIIGLTHLHLADDIEVAKLKVDYPNFLFIAGGHEHEPEFEPETPGSAAIVKGASNARTVWQIDIDFSGSQVETAYRQIKVEESIPIDPDYQQISDRWRGRLLALMPFLESRVGEAAVPLDAREVTVRNQESNWANFIVDQMRPAFGEPIADFAFVNSGTLRIDDFIAEDITFEDIGRTFGFSSFLRKMTINGADFRSLMEAGYRGEGPSKGYFPQISGFRVCVDRRRPDGERIVQMMVPDGGGWHEIDRSRDYTLVVGDFVFRGGDGYDFSKARDVSLPGSELKYLVLDGIIRAQAEGKAIGANIDPDNRRIDFLSSGMNNCFE